MPTSTISSTIVTSASTSSTPLTTVSTSSTPVTLVSTTKPSILIDYEDPDNSNSNSGNSLYGIWSGTKVNTRIVLKQLIILKGGLLSLIRKSY